MRVTWKEQVISDDMAGFLANNDDWNPDDQFEQRYGEVIGTSRSFFGNTYLTVGCEDCKIREVEISKATICTI